MRKIPILATLLSLALAGCGGGGGSSSPQPPPPTQAPVTQGNLVTPQFTIVVPSGKTSSGQRKPNYVSSGTLSVQITLGRVFQVAICCGERQPAL